MSYKVKSSTIGFRVMDGDKSAYEVTVGPYGASAIITDSKGRFCSVPLDGKDFAPHYTFPMPQEAIDAVNRGISALREGRVLDEPQPSQPTFLVIGKAGDGCGWSLDDRGHLIISGEGAMYDFVDGAQPDYVSRYRDRISKVTIEEGITKIGACSFAGLPVKEAWIGLGVSEIGNAAFNNCHKLDSVVIPSSVEKIGAHAFSYSGLSDVLICEGVKEIGSSAFAHCSGLDRINLPYSVEQVGDYAFSYTGAVIHAFNPDKVPDAAIFGDGDTIISDANQDWGDEEIADDISEG